MSTPITLNHFKRRDNESIEYRGYLTNAIGAGDTMYHFYHRDVMYHSRHKLSPIWVINFQHKTKRAF